MSKSFSELIEVLDKGEIDSTLLHKVLALDFDFEVGTDDQRYCLETILLDKNDNLTSDFITIIWDHIVEDYGFGIDLFEYFNVAITAIAESIKTPTNIIDSIAFELIPTATEEEADEDAIADLLLRLKNNPNAGKRLTDS